MNMVSDLSPTTTASISRQTYSTSCATSEANTSALCVESGRATSWSGSATCGGPGRGGTTAAATTTGRGRRAAADGASRLTALACATGDLGRTTAVHYSQDRKSAQHNEIGRAKEMKDYSPAGPGAT